MKFLIAFCTIFILFFINSAESDCSSKSWNVVKNLDVGKILGRWYCVLRFFNGKNDTSDCLWHDLRMHPTIPNAIQNVAQRTFKNGRGHRKHQIEGALTLTDPSKTEGVIHLSFKKGAIVDASVLAFDYNEYALLMSCFDGEDHFWAYSRTQYPSNATLTKIYKDIDEKGIDRSKIMKSCTDIQASEIV